MRATYNKCKTCGINYIYHKNRSWCSHFTTNIDLRKDRNKMVLPIFSKLSLKAKMLRVRARYIFYVSLKL